MIHHGGFYDYLFVHDDSLTSKRFTTQLTECCEPLKKIKSDVRALDTSRQLSGKGAIRKKFLLQKPWREINKLTIRYLYLDKYTRLYDGADLKLFILASWGRSFLSVDWPTGVQLGFFFCSGVSKLFGAQGSPSSGSLLNLLSPRF